MEKKILPSGVGLFLCDPDWSAYLLLSKRSGVASKIDGMATYYTKTPQERVHRHDL